MINVETSNHLKNQFKDKLEDFEMLISHFTAYKKNPHKEHSIFGKDESYHTHTIGNKNILMHVHMIPILDEIALETWFDVYDKNRKLPPGRVRKDKTSDTCLVYIEEPKDQYFLIAVFEEPDAHKLCYNKQFMSKIISIAEDYYFHGKVS